MTTMKSFRKFERTVSVFFLVNIIAELLIPLKIYSHSSQVMSGAGSSPVAAATSSMVDGYTGDFRYSVPLLTVPGPNGESVPITAGYHAGIGVNQKASWIGLGWDYSPGEISRSVVGTPDDYNGKEVNELIGAAVINKVKRMFGAIYTKNINTVTSSDYLKSNDFYTIYRHLPENRKRNMMFATDYESSYYDTDRDKYRFNRYSIPFQAIAYDDYHVSGGVSGKLHPFTLGENKFHSERPYNDVSMAVNTNKVQFYFANSSSQNINSTTATNSTYVNQATNRIHSGTFVKYYTNAHINTADSLFNNTTQKGFLDYRTVSGTRRPSADFDPDGIGGFEVTDVNGITYHYSLPVYVWDDCSYEVTSKNISFSSDPYVDYLGSSIDGQQKTGKYARSWKLTAVTGPDYQDANNNKMVDEGDTGYWIGYNYSLWSNDYYSASQRFGCKEDGGLAKDAPSYFGYFNGKTFQPNTYKRTMNLSKNRSQVYVLNYIQTASHTAFFVKSVRLDEQSYDNMVVSTDKPAPLLKLDRIILMENTHKATLINSTDMSSGDKDSRFSYASCSEALSDPNFVHVTKYNSNIAAIKAASLKSVEFETDYTLAPKYVGNITNTVSYKPVKHATYPNVFFYNKLNSVSNASTQSGKLTLNKIKFYELNGEKMTPSVDFDYAVTDTTKNPVCHEDKTDLWGYYKNDYVNSHYTTDVSRQQTDAWSLREITTPLGSKIKIEYESDLYHSEGFADDPDFMPVPNVNLGSPYHTSGNKAHGPIKTTIPHLIFPMESYDENEDEYVFEDADSYPYGAGYGRDQSIPYEQYNCLIVNFMDRCTRQILYYNGGNSYIYTQPVEKLVHRGQSQYYTVPASSGTVSHPPPSSYSRGPHQMVNSSVNPVAEDFDLSAQCTAMGTGFNKSLANNVINFKVFFRSYLYGGGIRVKQIQTIEPYKDLTYTQLFTYGKGYCPVVPKPVALCYGIAPSAYDLCVNFKPLLNPQINSRVGYDYIQTTTINEKGETNGSVKQEFTNFMIANPLAIDHCQMIKGTAPLQQGANPSKIVGSCNYYTPLSPPAFDSYLHPNNYYFTMSLNRGDQFLGKLGNTQVMDASDRLVSLTEYKYGASSFIEEKNKPSSSLSTLDSYSFVTPSTCPNTNPVESSLFSFIYAEQYIYNFTYRFYNSSQVIGTSTTRDGIKIESSTTSIDPLTNLQTATTSNDPTIGQAKTEVDYAYKNSSYTSLGLKSVNENYKNQPALLLESKTKKGKYVIGNSKITYTNVYPTREYDAANSKYKNANITKNWYRVNETHTRLLDDDVLATTTPTSDDWRKTSTGTLYDKEGNRIEEAGLNERETASKWGYNNRYKLATISNANYNSFTYTGFEDQLTVNTSPSTIHFGGEVSGGQLRLSAATANAAVVQPHTGKYMVGVNPGATGPVYNTENFEKGRTYVAKVWVHVSSPPTSALTLTLTGTTGSGPTPLSLGSTVLRSNTANVKVGSWILMSTEITVPDNFNLGSAHSMAVKLSAPGDANPAYFDDLTFHPKDAVLTGNVYDEKTGLLVAQLDNENFATLYNYDHAGRILTTYKEYSGGIKKITESAYHFAKP